MKTNTEQRVAMIPIEQIRVLNPRCRNKAKFKQIVTNIRNIGLKRPITVSHSSSKDGKGYDLVCGQGRLEAYVALGQEEIPAVIIKVSKEDCFLMSLVENLARRQQLSVELVQQIGLLKERGYASAEIAAKIDVTKEYVRGIVRLLECGEERLISAVEKGQVPISTAVEISSATDEDAQLALLEAYKKKKLRGNALTHVRRLIEQRRTYGKQLFTGVTSGRKKALTANILVKTYRKEVERQTMLVRKAKVCEARLLFIVSALGDLFQDDHFATLLRAEAIDSMPKYVADQIKDRQQRGAHEKGG
ncbi:chromosome partitioning protein ParB [Desulfosarcina widdelii]|uniref:Chromosome partitioning protein ParB n=1 Tax=Desulfosarcina widdelii TaxID=947919 RepID=A0A5K7Z671_9BACT|nr:plasmid partitioning protein RepB C-terminal domain-containing protein [Desulfosarcina widdelii]BBO76240.1 chromosome partitioning protein ParB [Desulfosarcina widdelii]